MNTPRENPHAWYNFVQDNGVEELRNDFEGTVVNFCVSWLDGLWGLSPAKYAQLAARGIIVSRDAEQVLIPDSMREFIEWIFQTYW